MNMKTINRVNLQLLKQSIENTPNKENQPPNMPHPGAEDNKFKRVGSSKDEIINLRKQNARKVQEINLQKEEELRVVREQCERESREIVTRYERMIREKDEYIRLLEEMVYGHDDGGSRVVSSSRRSTQRQPRPEEPARKASTSTQQSLYTHQGPLYSNLCYSIDRPKMAETLNPRSQASSIEKHHVRITGSTGKNRSLSTTRMGGSKHTLVPACRPTIAKIL